MSYTLRELHAAERHVALAQNNVRTQGMIIAQFAGQGLESDEAYQMLGQLLSTLQYLQHRCNHMRASLTSEAPATDIGPPH